MTWHHQEQHPAARRGGLLPVVGRVSRHYSRRAVLRDTELVAPPQGDHGGGRQPALRPDDHRPSAAASPLRRRRSSVGLTLQQFASAVFVSTATASRWETGRRRPHLDQLPRIAEVLGVNAGCLLTALSGAPDRVADTVTCPGLRFLRTSAGLSRRTLAERLAVSIATVAHWECGRRRLPRERLPSIAAALAVPLGDLEGALSRPAPGPSRSPLRELRLGAGVTQAHAAAELGVTASTVSGYERGLRQVPYRHLRRLAVTYEQSIPTLARAARQVPVPHPDDLARDRIRPATLIRAARVWDSVTRAELGRRAGVHPETIRRWEEGTTRPTSRQLELLEPVLGLRVGSLRVPTETDRAGRPNAN